MCSKTTKAFWIKTQILSWSASIPLKIYFKTKGTIICWPQGCWSSLRFSSQTLVKLEGGAVEVITTSLSVRWQPNVKSPNSFLFHLHSSLLTAAHTIRWSLLLILFNSSLDSSTCCLFTILRLFYG